MIWHVTMHTSHFYFDAFGATEEEANEAIGRALEWHRQQYRLDADWWSDYDFNTRLVALGAGYRDEERVA